MATTALIKPLHPEPRLKRYAVTRRACSANEPEWAVYSQGSGSSADVIAHFFTQEGADSYAEWRNRRRMESA